MDLLENTIALHPDCGSQSDEGYKPCQDGAGSVFLLSSSLSLKFIAEFAAVI